MFIKGWFLTSSKYIVLIVIMQCNMKIINTVMYLYKNIHNKDNHLYSCNNDIYNSYTWYSSIIVENQSTTDIEKLN